MIKMHYKVVEINYLYVKYLLLHVDLLFKRELGLFYVIIL